MKFQIAKYKNFEDTYGKEVEKTIDFLKNGDFKSANSKKLSNSNYFRAKINSKGRLLFQFTYINGISYILLLELLPNHEYESSQFLKGKKFFEEDFIFNQSNIDKNLSDEKYFQYTGKFIIFNKIQENILYTKPPLIIVGSAGSGKTSVAIEKLRTLKNNVLYLSLSQELVNNAKTICGNYENIDFLSFEQFTNNIEKQEGKVIDFYLFKKWAYNNKIKEIEKYFEEFKGVLTAEHNCEYISLERYKKLGKNQSLFSESKREEIYSKFIKYLQFLKENNIYDNNITIYHLFKKIKETYDFIVIDEIQDFTNKEIALVISSLKDKHNFIFSGDSNQIIYSNFFSWSQLKTMLYKNKSIEVPINILQENYRNAKSITKIANNLLKIKQLQFGSIDRESNYLIETKSDFEGNIHFYEATEYNIKEINQETQNSRKVAVIAYDEIAKEEIKKSFKTALVYTVQEIKGLEYEEIILVNFVSNNKQFFNEIIKDIHHNDLLEELKYNRTGRKDSENRLENYKIYINSLYVALTRAMKKIYILEKNNHKIFELLGIIKEKKKEIIVEQSSKEEWEDEAKKLEKLGKLEQVEGIRKKIFNDSIKSKEIIKDIDLFQLKDEALNPNKFNKKAKDTFFKIVKEKNQLIFIEELAELKYTPAIKYLNNLKINNTSIRQKKEIEKIIEYAYYGKSKQLEKLINGNANIDFQDKNGISALSVASDQNQKEVVLLLLNKGANPNIQGKNGFTPLMLASGKKYKTIVKLLLDKGANPNIESFDNAFTSLVFATASGNKEIVQLLLDNNANIEHKTKDGETPLMFAVQNQQEEIVQFLLERGSNPNIQRKDGETALMFASAKNNIPIIKLLLDNGANPNLQREDGISVLMLSIEYNQKEIIKMLVENGANRNLESKKGDTAYSLASKKEDKTILELLI